MMKNKNPFKEHHLLHLALVLVVAISSCVMFFYICNVPINLSPTFVTETTTTPTTITMFPLSSNQRQHCRSRQFNHTQNAPLRFFIVLPTKTTRTTTPSPYHNWQLFSEDFRQMMQHFRIFVYPDAFSNSTPFANIFLPHPNPLLNARLGNYFSEHIFKVALLHSSLLTAVPEQAHFFFLPFSINDLRNDHRVHSEVAISQFVAQYTTSISHRFRFWNASQGADHFYVCCHSVGREAPSKHRLLHNNAIQLTCSSSYFQRFYISHKDVALPQVWPRPPLQAAALTPPHARHRLVFFAGRPQNSQVRQQLINLWANDSNMDIYYGSPPFPYEQGFKRSKYCLQVKGYEVNTARLSDAIYYGCVPVIISNYYDLPFANVLDWSKFSVIIRQEEAAFLKRILLAITRQTYLDMYHNLCKVRRHFEWHTKPRGYDSFYMTAYQLWFRRSIHRLSY